ncbi:MAG TPA: serine/threonine protein kinase [Candidatus Ruthenibacterium merdavium]|uniref:Serine/threonine protein kinase n=1 Tax=Candidatus Ruthenibacterium merdavium TaxID=2838752 RepID=A0A9D2Q6Y6_9FIRM|nr:serine/threonine protein kinase [Candidatus Ruthenibacterium merdavium]
MDVSAELRLSFYRNIAMLNEKHGVALVQHIETKKVFVKKTLTIYDTWVFQYLMEHPVPGIPKIEELVEENGRLHVIEEYISGLSLREKLDLTGPLDTDTAVSYMQQLCTILRPLHQLLPPIVHRDIKPSNIIVTSAGVLYLVDFNAAKQASDRKERDTVLIGTFGYAAPEQYGFSASQPATDIYALGVLFNEMLTGKKPQEEMAVGPFASVIKKCIEIEPSKRYKNIGQLLEQIHAKYKKMEPQEPASLRKWLLPGFRTKKPFRWLLAGMWYAFVIYLCMNSGSQNQSASKVLILRFVCFVIFFAETFWVGNYQNIHSYFPLANHSNLLVRILGILLWGFVILIAIIMIFAILFPNF